jgi:RsiW-degrading membrane proteinase PrsW (M82 family)
MSYNRFFIIVVCSCISMTFFSVFIYLSVIHQITWGIIFWSIFLGIVLGALLVSIMKRFYDKDKKDHLIN